MNFDEVKELIDQVDQSNLKVFELDNDEISIKMSKNTDQLTAKEESSNFAVHSVGKEEEQNTIPPQSNAQGFESKETHVEVEIPEDVHEVTAPIVGTSYLAPSPEKPPFVNVGDKITKGEPLVIVEAMKVMNEIKSNVDGVIDKILVEDGQPIEFGQALVQIKES